MGPNVYPDPSCDGAARASRNGAEERSEAEQSDAGPTWVVGRRMWRMWRMWRSGGHSHATGHSVGRNFLSPFSNGSKLGIAAIWARFFQGKISPSGTKRVRTARCMTLVHLCLFLSIACGHLPGIFGRVTTEPETLNPRTKDTERDPTRTPPTFTKNPTAHQQEPLKSHISTANQYRTPTRHTHSLLRIRQRAQHPHDRTAAHRNR